MSLAALYFSSHCQRGRGTHECSSGSSAERESRAKDTASDASHQVGYEGTNDSIVQGRAPVTSLG